VPASVHTHAHARVRVRTHAGTSAHIHAHTRALGHTRARTRALTHAHALDQGRVSRLRAGTCGAAARYRCSQAVSVQRKGKGLALELVRLHRDEVVEVSIAMVLGGFLEHKLMLDIVENLCAVPPPPTGPCGASALARMRTQACMHARPAPVCRPSASPRRARLGTYRGPPHAYSEYSARSTRGNLRCGHAKQSKAKLPLGCIRHVRLVIALRRCIAWCMPLPAFRYRASLVL
jgi:hypothetical protein